MHSLFLEKSYLEAIYIASLRKKMLEMWILQKK